MKHRSFKLQQDKFYVTCISEKNVDKFREHLNKFSEYPIVAILNFEKTINLNSIKNERATYIIGKQELRFMKNSKKDRSEFLSWLENLNLSLFLTFENGSRILIINGGITDEKSSDDLGVKLCFADNVWSSKYKGSLGYVISAENHNNPIKIYNYSATLNSNSKDLVFQEVNSLGLGETLIL